MERRLQKGNWLGFYQGKTQPYRLHQHLARESALEFVSFFFLSFASSPFLLHILCTYKSVTIIFIQKNRWGSSPVSPKNIDANDVNKTVSKL